MRRSSKQLPKDPYQLAAEIVRISTEEQPGDLQNAKAPPRSPISEYLAQIGQKGGLKGGKARAKALSAKKRADIARKAAKSRWALARKLRTTAIR
jgi:hypothetical protein